MIAQTLIGSPPPRRLAAYQTRSTVKAPVPLGRATTTSSPTRLPSTARAIGDSTLMKRCAGSNSSAPTIRNSRLSPSSPSSATQAPK